MKISKYNVKELGPGAKVRIIRKDIHVVAPRYGEAFREGRILAVNLYAGRHWHTDGDMCFLETELEVL